MLSLLFIKVGFHSAFETARLIGDHPFSLIVVPRAFDERVVCQALMRLLSGGMTLILAG